MLCCEKFYFRHESFPFGIHQTCSFSFFVKFFLSAWDFFFLHAMRRFLSTWHFFFLNELFSMHVRLFLVSNFYFICQTFSFRVRHFFSPRDFNFPRETFLVRMFPLKIFLPKVNISGQPYKKDLASYVDCV